MYFSQKLYILIYGTGVLIDHYRTAAVGFIRAPAYWLRD